MGLRRITYAQQAADVLQDTLDSAVVRGQEIRGIMERLGKSRRFLEQLLAYAVAISEVRSPFEPRLILFTQP